MCSESSSVAVKLVAKILNRCCQLSMEKTVVSKWFLLLAGIKCNIPYLPIGELNKIMSVAFHNYTGKNIKLSVAEACYLTKFGLALNKCCVIYSV